MKSVHAQALRSLARSAVHEYRQRVEIARWAARGVAISPKAILLFERGSEIDIGRGANIGRHTLVSVRSAPRTVRTERPRLTIGERTSILEFNNIRAGAPMEIGAGCLISQFVTLLASSHDLDSEVGIRDAPWTTPGLSVGNGVWIGAGAVVLPGVVVGDDAVIAAGAVVTEDVPPRAVVGGVPARVLRYR